MLLKRLTKFFSEIDDLRQSKSHLEKAFVHLEMVLHPRGGHERTIPKNTGDLGSFIYEVCKVLDKTNTKVASLRKHVRPEFNVKRGDTDRFFERVNTQLIDNHGYPSRYEIDVNELVPIMDHLLVISMKVYYNHKDIRDVKDVVRNAIENLYS